MVLISLTKKPCRALNSAMTCIVSFMRLIFELYIAIVKTKGVRLHLYVKVNFNLDRY